MSVVTTVFCDRCRGAIDTKEDKVPRVSVITEVEQRPGEFHKIGETKHTIVFDADFCASCRQEFYDMVNGFVRKPDGT